MRLPLPTIPGDLPISAARAAEQRVQLALWASGESVWEWDAATDCVKVDVAEGAVLPLIGIMLTAIFTTNRHPFSELTLWRSRTEWRNYRLVTGFR